MYENETQVAELTEKFSVQLRVSLANAKLRNDRARNLCFLKASMQRSLRTTIKRPHFLKFSSIMV